MCVAAEVKVTCWHQVLAKLGAISCSDAGVGASMVLAIVLMSEQAAGTTPTEALGIAQEQTNSDHHREFQHSPSCPTDK